MVEFEEQTREQSVREVASKMMIAARTAPKTKGADVLEIATFTGQEVEQIAAKMKELGPKLNKMFFLRDADNILASDAVVVIGANIKIAGLDCGLCGFETCADKLSLADAPCAFNAVDLGIAVGSAVSMAADCRVDNRVMYSVGVAIKELKMLRNSSVILAIPISSTGKNLFFDRPSSK